MQLRSAKCEFKLAICSSRPFDDEQLDIAKTNLLSEPEQYHACIKFLNSEKQPPKVTLSSLEIKNNQASFFGNTWDDVTLIKVNYLNPSVEV